MAGLSVRSRSLIDYYSKPSDRDRRATLVVSDRSNRGWVVGDQSLMNWARKIGRA